MFVVIATSVLLVAAPAAPQSLDAPLSLDPAIRSGTLPNGLTYFIRRNSRPEKRAALRLVVEAGSIDEDDDQRGLAHVLEHMAFNGTAHFKPGELVAYLESIGARFGPHVNAYTNYDETVYMLDVPTDREGLLARGFVALADFAGGMTLDPVEIDRERGVVIEEWRGRQGAGSRVQVVHGAALYGGSKYAARLPIGTPEVLKTFTPQRLRDFYQKWYRPDRMAVVVVGDMDPVAAQQLVATHFSALKSGAPADRRPVHPIPAHDETRFGIATDPEAQESSVAVVFKRPLEAMRTAADYRRSLVRSLVLQMVNERFREIARQPDAPFLAASSQEETFGRTVEAFMLSGRVTDGGIENGLSALTREAARIEQHGFGDAELDRGRKFTLAAYERSYNEREKSESASFAFELIRHVLDGEPVPGIQAEYDLAKAFVPTITNAEAGALARELIGESNRVVLVVAPSRKETAAPTEAALRAALQRGSSSNVTAWRDSMAGRELLPRKPTAGTVTATREIPEVGITVLTLSNGATVWLKPTDFKNDQVLFTSYARGGTSLASPAEYYAAALTSSLVAVGGIGGLTPVELGKLLPGQLVNASAYISSYTHGVNGSSTPRDLETALQLLHLHFTAPNRTPESFELLKRRLHALIANQAQSPGAVFAERVRQINTMNHYTARAVRPEDVNALSADTMRAYYDARFGNASDFTFFFVGAFDVAAVTPLMATYIGSLPSPGSAAARIGDVRLEFPAGVQRETVNQGKEPKSHTVISFFADTGLDEMEMHRTRAATSILELRLRDLLREALGGTYSVNVGYSNTQPQTGYGAVGIEFGSAPDNVDRLVKAVLGEVAALRAAPPSAEEVRTIQEMERRDLETSLRQNAYWLNALQTAHQLGWDARRIARRLERTDTLTRENIHAAFKRYFPEDRYTVVTLVPENATR